MKKIVLESVNIINNKISYKFSTSEDLKKFFSDSEFIIEYPFNIESVPLSVAAIPFVGNVLPIIWLTDSELILDELDEDFYNCIPEVKKGYKIMFPESEFLGKITADKIVKNDNAGNNCAMLYSGGLDSAQTLISHYKENPDLISLWGADIRYDNNEGWDIVNKGLKLGAEQFGLNHLVIKSTFRKFDNEWECEQQFSKQLKDDWWHGVKHGIAILSHVAVLSYLKCYKIVYIASTHCYENVKVRCASNPLTDNHVKFCGCQVVHDGFEFSRQDKIHNVVGFAKSHFPVKLHVCWQSQSGENCCHCEKCYRTMFGFLAENENPTKYGFEDFENAINNFDIFWLRGALQKSFDQRQLWTPIAKRVRKNKKELKKNIYWKQIKLIKNFDYRKPKTFKISFFNKCKRKVGTIFYKIKTKFTHK